jgi:predicted enzyme related to lactoylglutathione lyase
METVIEDAFIVRLSTPEAHNLLYFLKWADVDEEAQRIESNSDYGDVVEELYQELKKKLNA